MKKVILGIIILLFCLFLYGKYIEVKNLTVREYTINNENIPNSFKELKIIHFSDVLYKPNTSKSNLEKLIKKINEEEADIVIFAGDLLSKDVTYNNEDLKYLTDSFKNINASLFKYAVIGDNDKKFIDNYKDILYESNFILLDNANKLLFYKDNTPINIIGITNLENINTLFETDVSYNYTLAITHEPDKLEDLSKYEIDTLLSGHSLGGIINVPYYGGIIKKDGAKTYINDNYILNNTEIFISNGIGYENFEFRLFNTPSFNVYRFDNN